MTSRAPTLSGLSLVAACPGSASLPRQQRVSGPAASLGTAIHEMIEHRIGGHNVGSDYDVARLSYVHGLAPDDAGRLAFLAEHLRLPVPPGALAEVPLGYWLPERDAEVTPGTVRRIEGGAGSYPDAGQVLSGTIDAMWAEPYPFRTFDGATEVECHHPDHTLWICDWKAGDQENVTPIARNWQLRAGALLAARWTGATRVIPAICYVNAAECAVAVREGRRYEGRWEVGAPLDAAALDAIEVELRAVLRAARGSDDEVSVWNGEGARRGVEPGPGVHLPIAGGMDEEARMPPLILGPHCEHCPARGACPALAAEAVALSTGAGLYLPPGGALTTAAASHLAGLIPAARRMLDAAEEAVRAHVRAFGPVRLSDGREYGPHLETVTGYRTQPTFDALAPIVGEERANDAAEYTATSIKRALAEAGAPRGAWGRLRATIETAGGVVVTAREVWRRTQAATPVEVVSDGVSFGRDGSGHGGDSGGVADPAPVGVLVGESEGRAREAHPDHGGGGRGEAQGGIGESVGDVAAAGAPVISRAICPTCKRPDVAVNRKGGALRKHYAPGTSMYCHPVASAQIAMVEA